MWDSNTPLQLLNSMPKVLEDEHLAKLQKLLEADKDKNQLLSDTILCGSYAPFCDGCNKEIKHPCAVAYVNYLKGKGIDIDIAEDLPQEASLELPEEVVGEEVAATDEGAEVTEEIPEDSVEVSEEPDKKIEHNRLGEKDGKTRIRIAIARKKTIL